MFDSEKVAREADEKATAKAVREGKNAQEASKIGRQAGREAKAGYENWITENVGLD